MIEHEKLIESANILRLFAVLSSDNREESNAITYRKAANDVQKMADNMQENTQQEAGEAE